MKVENELKDIKRLIARAKKDRQKSVQYDLTYLYDDMVPGDNYEREIERFMSFVEKIEKTLRKEGYEASFEGDVVLTIKWS